MLISLCRDPILCDHSTETALVEEDMAVMAMVVEEEEVVVVVGMVEAQGMEEVHPRMEAVEGTTQVVSTQTSTLDPRQVLIPSE